MKRLIILVFGCGILCIGAVMLYSKLRGHKRVYDLGDSPLPITVDYDNQIFTASTKAPTVEVFLKEQGIEVNESDLLFPARSQVIYPGLKVKVRRQVPFAIKVDGREIKGGSFKRTVAEVLEEQGVLLNHPDKVSPSLSDGVSRNMEIEVTRINIEEVAVEEEIDFKTIDKDDNTLNWRKTKVGQVGEKGIRETVYRVTYTNGSQTSKVKISSTVTKQPVSEIILHGTKITVGKVSKGKASWYSHMGGMFCASLEHPKGTWLRVSANGKSVIVQVNDSGPYSDKIIDLDKPAFQKLGALGQGVLMVKVEEILE